MSTRANIVVKDSFRARMWFYRHSDGYPRGALPLLAVFMQAVADEKIRNNVGQSAGHLITLGAKEYEGIYPPGSGMDWKVGAIEPTTGQHGDIEYMYILDLDKQTIEVKTVPFWFGEGKRAPRGHRIALLAFHKGMSTPVVEKAKKEFTLSMLDLQKSMEDFSK